MTVVSGVVKLADGTPVKRLVRAYHQHTGQLLAQGFSLEADGTYTLNAGSSSDYVTVMVLDLELGDPYNDYVTAFLPFTEGSLEVKSGLAVALAGAAAFSYDIPRFGGVGSMKFTGASSDCVTVTATGTEFILGDTYTVEASVYITSMPSGPCRVLMVGSNATAQAVTLEISAAGAIKWGVPNTGATSVVSASGAITTGSWQDIVVTCERGAARIFVNGTLAAGPTAITQQASSTQNLRIGGESASGFNTRLTGYVGDVRFTNAVNRYPTSPGVKLDIFMTGALSGYGRNACIFDNVLSL